MRVKVNDRASFAITRREYTDEGFLRVPGRVARTGVQEYLASELGLTDRAPNEIVRVMRPPEEVFADESLASYAGTDVTIDHPSTLVNADTYRSVSVGTISGPGRQDQDYVECDLIVKTKDGIQAAENGRSQLSVGYTALYDDDVPSDADYDFIQREIRVNHVALVERARAGAQARIFDNDPRGITMHRIVLDSGRHAEVQDEATATLITDTLERLRAQVTTKTNEFETLSAVKDTLEEQLAEARKASSDEAIADRVSKIAAVRDSAKRIAGAEFTCDSLVPLEIQRAALAVKRPNIAWGDKSDAYVAAAFDQAEEQAKEAEDKDDEEKDKDGKPTGDAATSPYRQLSKDAAKVQTGDAVTTARNGAADRLTGGWKSTIGEA